ncbi:MAG: LptA/OstA family protein [bacterium]
MKRFQSTQKESRKNTTITMKHIYISISIIIIYLIFLNSLPEQKSQEEKYIIEADKTEGIIDGDERIIIGTGNVKITHGKLIITCDKGTSYEKQEMSVLENNVVIDDKEQGYHLTAGYVEYHKKDKHSIATKNPILIIKKKENPIRVESEMMEMFSKEDIGIARGNVWIYYEDIVAQCDLATYYGKENRIILEGDPVAWQGENRLSGKKITLFIKDDKADKIFVDKDARMIYYTKGEKKTEEKDDEVGSIEVPSSGDVKEGNKNENSEGAIKEIETEKETTSKSSTGTNERGDKKLESDEKKEDKGEETIGRVDTYGEMMTAYFKDGEVIRVLIEGNAQGVYYPYEDEKPTDEKVFASGDKIDVTLKDRKAERIRVLGSVGGYYDPGKKGGQTKAYGDTMIIFIENGEVDRIIIRGKAKGIYYHGKEEGEETKVSD